MSGETSSTRRRADRCPGVLRPHQAADGHLARLRVPGGRTTASALLQLSRIAAAHGNPDLQLTSRGGLQIRGLGPDLSDDFAQAVTAAGFLPARDHERVRNITASPLTGISGGATDLRQMITDLDQALIAEPALARLPGRFLFVLDDGRGDVRGLTFDIGYSALDSDHGVVLLGGSTQGITTTAAGAVPTMIDLALDFLRAHDRSADRPWHVQDMPDWIADRPGITTVDLGPTRPVAPLGRVGLAASVQVPLALLTPAQAEVIAEVAVQDQVVITPWRGVILPGAAAALPTLVAAGLVGDTDSAWSQLTACVGAPSCASALADTRNLASALASTPGLPRTHISGCDRRCGAPTSDHLDLVAPITVAEARERIADR